MEFKELEAVGIEVTNRKNGKTGQYIGRGSILGNRFLIGRDGTRLEVIEKYRKWLWVEVGKKQAVFGELNRLFKIWKRDGKLTLSCFCFPKRCHGEVVGSCLAWMDK
jgi:hypothetical protein